MSTLEWKTGAGGKTHLLMLMHGGSALLKVGELIELNRAWFVQTYPGKDMYWLDKHLTLDEAKRAAKLFIYVGREHEHVHL